MSIDWIKRLIRAVLGQDNGFMRPSFSSLPRAIAEFDTIEGFLSPREATALFRYASKLKARSTVVEIGSWKGKSTFCLARGLRRGKLFAIDPFDASGEPGSVETYQRQKGEEDLLTQFRERMTKMGVIETIEILQGRSVEFKDRFKRIDLLFIDGDHSIDGCTADFTLFAPRIVSGGYLLFHDYYPERDELGPTWVIKNLVASTEEFEHIVNVDSMWIGKRK